MYSQVNRLAIFLPFNIFFYMARVTYGALVTEINGKVGGTVFQRNAYGFTVKNKPNMVLPNSVDQMSMQRAAFRCTQAWQSLSDSQRTDWETYASSYPQYAKNNPSSQLSAYNVFLLRNMIAYYTGMGAVISPSIVSTINSAFAPTIQVDATQMLLNLSPTPAPSGLGSYLSATNPMPGTASIARNLLRFFDYRFPISSSMYIQDTYLARFSRLPVVGESILIKFSNVAYNCGAVFAPQFFKVVCTAL